MWCGVWCGEIWDYELRTFRKRVPNTVPDRAINMASARKKQDEKHLKLLRDLVSNSQNRQCFDCHQRGPTYVNMTIGSFVCTSCSGILRGLTPPHRVKSISMASFSPEEIEFILKRGNEYCRRIWLGLYDASRGRDTHDEQGIKSFMIAKYEKKRYYLEPSMANLNGTATPTAAATAAPTAATSSTTPSASTPQINNVNSTSRPSTNLVQSITMPALSSVSNQNNALNTNSSSSGFLADFSSAEALSSVSHPDPFSLPAPPTSNTISNFANFDNNPIFESTNNGFPQTFNLPTSASFPVTRKSSNGSAFQAPPPEDRYAALKDLDCLMKSQNEPQPEWLQAAAPGTTSNPSAPAVGAGSSWQPFGSALPNSAFGDCNATATSNPFVGAFQNGSTTCGSPWGGTVESPVGANPFKTARPVQESNPMFPWGVGSTANNGAVVNGFHSSQSFTFPTKTWATETEGNPFTLGASTAGHSSNPFL